MATEPATVKPNPFVALLGSRKFLLMLLDVVVSGVLFFSGKYATPDALDNVKFLIAALQPVFITVIASIAHEDAAQIKADSLRPSP